MTDKTLSTIQKEVSPLLTEAKLLTITDTATMQTATTILSQLNKIADRIDLEKSKVLDPLNLARKNELARWKPITLQYDEAISIVRQSMSEYQTKESARAKSEQEAIASRIKTGKGNLSLETGLKKLEEVTKPDELIDTQEGSVTFRPIQHLNIINEALIPRLFLVPNESLILNTLKAGTPVAGCEITIIQTPYNKR